MVTRRRLDAARRRLDATRRRLDAARRRLDAARVAVTPNLAHTKMVLGVQYNRNGSFC
jgi:hypothetical protein